MAINIFYEEMIDFLLNFEDESESGMELESEPEPKHTCSHYAISKK